MSTVQKIYRIAVHRLKAHYRKKRFKSLFRFVCVEKRGPKAAETAEVPEEGSGISKKDFWRQIDKMPTRLSAMEKEAFLLRFFRSVDNDRDECSALQE